MQLKENKSLDIIQKKRRFVIVDAFKEFPLLKLRQARNLRRCALKAGKTSTRKTENLAHLTYPHTESGMRKK